MVVLTVILMLPPKLSHVTLNVVLLLVPSTTGLDSTLVPRPVVLELKPEQEPPILSSVVELLALDQPLIPKTVTLNVVLLIVLGILGEDLIPVPRLAVLELKPELEPRTLKPVVVILAMEQLLKPKIVKPILAQSLALVPGPNGKPSAHVMEPI